MQYTGAQILIQSLIDQGVDTLFGYPGGAVLNIYDALYERQDQLHHIITSHEQGAAHAADGYARSTGKTGVVLATSGPGATNLVTGIATAYMDSVPMVAITGNVTKDLIGRDSFQEVDIVTVTNPIVKHNYLIQDIESLAETVREAFVIANSGRKGPVLIDIPKDITAQKTAYTPLPKFRPRENQKPDTAALAEIAEVIRQAKRPLIYCGGGVVFSDCTALFEAFADQLDAPVCTSMMGISALPADSPRNLGLVGMHGTPYANRAVSECDLLLTIGARFSDRVAGNRAVFAHRATIVQLDIDPAEIDKNVRTAYSAAGSAQDCMTTLLEMLPKQEHADWNRQVEEYRHTMPLPDSASDDNRLNPRDILLELSKVMGTDGIIATDVGQHQMLTAQSYPFFKPRSFLSSCGFGTMGYGTGAALGAAMGNPGRRVALITGDGSFHMNLAELATMVSNQLPVIILVMNNRVLGMVHQWQNLFYGARYSSTEINRQTSFPDLARAFGAEGFTIETQTDIRPVLEQAYQCKGPCVIDCRIDAEERVFPIVPPGADVSDMIFAEQGTDE